jgi:chemotaxis protein histidine kinase CheA
VREVSALGASAPTPLISPSLRAAENAVQRPGAEAHAQASVIRVRSESIDELVRQIGETLVVANGMGTELARHGDAEFALLRAGIARLGGGGGPLLDMVDRLRDGMRAMAGLHERLDQAIQNLHEQTLELRVVPLDALFTRLLRAARELAQTQDKRVNFQAEGRDVRIDKTIVEQLASPLTHMVRNAIDHGIETAENRLKAGKVGTASFTLSAIQRGNEVTIRLSDDGRGLDEQRILATAIQRGLLNPEEADFLPQAEIHRLIFLPGFSTADKITETSGRGVGMDVVLTTVTGLGGRIDIHSEPGKGTTFSIHLPLSAALQTALLVGAGGQMLAVPERHLTEVRRVAEDEIRPVRGQPCLGVRGALLPVFSLAELLGLPQAAPAGGESASVLVVASGPTRIGLKVDRLYRRQELYMKDLHPRLAAIPGLAGATVLGDGQVVLMLDGEGLIRRARSRAALLAGDAA